MTASSSEGGLGPRFQSASLLAAFEAKIEEANLSDGPIVNEHARRDHSRGVFRSAAHASCGCANLESVA